MFYGLVVWAIKSTATEVQAKQVDDYIHSLDT